MKNLFNFFKNNDNDIIVMLIILSIAIFTYIASEFIRVYGNNDNNTSIEQVYEPYVEHDGYCGITQYDCVMHDGYYYYNDIRVWSNDTFVGALFVQPENVFGNEIVPVALSLNLETGELTLN